MAFSVMVALAVLAASVVVPAAGAQGAGSGIVINEIHFHPACTVSYTPCADAPAEFIELYNSSDVTVDVSGWSLSEAVSVQFAAATVIAPGAYLVIADDAAGFQAAFGSAADAVWSGKLSNSGERIVLIDNAGAVVDEITYSDGSDTPGAWSVDADGEGDSLSLLSAENADGSSFWWDSAQPTPGQRNANAGQAPSSMVENFTWTVLPAANEPLVVSADVYNGAGVSLEYRINYPGSTKTISMSLDGGNTWTAQIPASAYSAGDLVRFRIVRSGTQVAPRTNDSIDWVGTTVADPGIDSALPVIEWFTDDDGYYGGYYERGSYFYDGVLAYDGEVWDNVEFRARGKSARLYNWTKRNWKFNFPDHHNFVVEGLSYGVDTVAFQGGYADDARIREYVGHTFAEEIGLVASQVEHVQLRLNGEYFGLHTMQEHPEGGFLKDNGLDNATLFSHVTFVRESGPDVPSPDWANWQTWDIPDFLNMTAGGTLLQHNDFAHNNFYAWYDADEHQRIESMLWDFDLSQGLEFGSGGGLLTGFELVWPNLAAGQSISVALDRPYRELYLRRLRTLADEWFGTGRFEQLARDTFDNITGVNGGVNEWALDFAEWGAYTAPSFTQQQVIERHATQWIDGYYGEILAGGPDGDIPGPQPANPNLQLIVDAAPGDQRRERIEIRNNENTAIDISGWQIGGSATATLAPGAVLPSRGSAYLVFDDTSDGYRALTNNHYVLGEYDAELADVGGAIALTDPSGTEHAAATWGAGPPPSGLILNEWNAVSASQLLADGDTRLGNIAGNGGDWFELVTVEDNLDVRGWTLDIFDDGSLDRTLTFANQDVFADLRAGTIITVAENPITADNGTVYDQDLSYAPGDGDWWIHLVAGAAGSGTHIDAENFVVSDDDWQLVISDAAGIRRFGPAGEGVGALAGGGVKNSEIGELETHPAADISPAANYDDGTESTFGQPNNFADQAQDFAALRPFVEPSTRDGDVNCDGNFDDADAQAILDFGVGLVLDSSGCPLSGPGEIYASAGDLSGDGTTDLLDALIVVQCVAGRDNSYCPPE